MEETIIRLAGIPVRFLCYAEKTIKFLRRYLPEDEEEAEAELTVDIRDLVTDPESMEKIPVSPYYEYSELILSASDALMAKGICFFHGAVFIWKDRAWILTAPSGTGKSTQYRNLKELYDAELFCLNGDKPALEFRRDGKIMVHDSPWRGKEGWGTAGPAYPLAGIFYLAQADHNEIRRFSSGEEVAPIYGQIFSARNTTDALHQISRLEDLLLKNTPVFLFENLGNPDSARLLHREMERLYQEETEDRN